MFVHNKRLVFQQAPKYLGVRLDRMLTSSNTLKKWQERLYLESHSSVVLLVQPFGASAKTLRISTQALVFTAAEYCAPDWSRSPHVKQVDVAINSSLWTIIIWLSQADSCVSAPCLSRDGPCQLKAESSHPRLGTESSEIRLDHHARHHNEWSASIQTQVP